MKKVFMLTAIVAASLIATKSNAQVYAGARFGHIGFAHVRIGVPVYAPAPAVIDYNEFPGYGYYNYPAWGGHFRDRIYYEHYRPVFMRSHPDFRGGYGGGFRGGYGGGFRGRR